MNLNRIIFILQSLNTVRNCHRFKPFGGTMFASIPETWACGSCFLRNRHDFSHDILYCFGHIFIPTKTLWNLIRLSNFKHIYAHNFFDYYLRNTQFWQGFFFVYFTWAYGNMLRYSGKKKHSQTIHIVVSSKGNEREKKKRGRI